MRAPWIGMTRGFWNDEERYLQTYWSRWPDIWVHGDWAAVDGDDCWYILGRSDDIILVAGKRLGPAEYESILVDHPRGRRGRGGRRPPPGQGNRRRLFLRSGAGHCR